MSQDNFIELNERLRKTFLDFQVAITVLIEILRQQPGFDNVIFEAEVERLLAKGIKDCPHTDQILRSLVNKLDLNEEETETSGVLITEKSSKVKIKTPRKSSGTSSIPRKK